MKIGICFEGRNLNGIDYSNPENGNPGVGGTTYLQLLLSYYLSKDYSDLNINLYTVNKQKLPNNIKQVVMKNDLEIIKQAEKDSVDLFIFIAARKNKDFYECLNNSKLSCIAWVHNYINYEEANRLHTCKAIKRIVFVGQQLYDSYIDDKIIKKSTYIYNMVPSVNHLIMPPIEERNGVAYIGAIIPAKGFHILAKQWKKIIKEVPTAKLYVIGSGNLYNNNVKMGKFGIAERKYEKKFIKYLLDKNGNILESVVFCGKMGNEKKDILKKVSVGVANPSGISETFCMSAVEMEQLGIPVVTYKGYGLLDTVIHNKTGLLTRSGNRLAKSVIMLLKDKQLNKVYGCNGIEYTRNMFAPEVIVPKWVELFKEIKEEQDALNLFSRSYYFDDLKWIKFCNYKFKKYINLNNLPSISACKSFSKELVKKILMKY